MWESDAGMMPTRLADPPACKDPNLGIQPARANLDTCFADFAGKAEIEWPEWGARLTMTSDESLGFLVIFTPPNADFFCVEPVSAMTDAVNRAEQGDKDSGLRTIAPGERFTATTVFDPQLI